MGARVARPVSLPAFKKKNRMWSTGRLTDLREVQRRARLHRFFNAAVTLGDMCVGIPALLQGTIKLRRSAAARRLTASPSPGSRGTFPDPPCLLELVSPRSRQAPKAQSAAGSTYPPQPDRGVPRVRDPEVVEGPTRPIFPPSDPVFSCLPQPRGVVLEPILCWCFSLTSIGSRSRWFTRRICVICAPEVHRAHAG